MVGWQNAFRVIQCSVASGILAVLLSTPAQATAVRVTITVDDYYGLYYGTENAATTFVGADSDVAVPETYNFDMPPGGYIYVVAASKQKYKQGVLAHVEIQGMPTRILTGEEAWLVAATGLGPDAPYTSSEQDLALLTREIQSANAKANVSGGWAKVTAGNHPFRMPEIDPAARWIWYSSDGTPDPTISTVDHKEWLIFRIKVPGEEKLSELVPRGSLVLAR